jgi:hypothetical protein
VTSFESEVGEYNLVYSTKPESGSWSTATIDLAGDVGRSCALDRASDGRLHVAHRDTTNHALMHMRCLSCAPPWDVTFVDEATAADDGDTSVQRTVDLAASPDGDVPVAYTDAPTTELRHAVLPSGSTVWQGSVVSDGAALFPAVAVLSTGLAHIVYLDVASGSLRHARQCLP